jgi:hypothetical protein
MRAHTLRRKQSVRNVRRSAALSNDGKGRVGLTSFGGYIPLLKQDGDKFAVIEHHLHLQKGLSAGARVKVQTELEMCSAV